MFNFRVLSVFVSLLSMMLILQNSRAIDLTDKFLISPYVGNHIFDGERNLKQGAEFGIGLEKFFGSYLSFGVSGGYIPTKERWGYQDRKIYPLNIFSSYSFYKKGITKNYAPYISIGIGGARALGINAGIGVRAFRDEKMAVKMEVRGFELLMGRHDLVVSIGIDYLFGGKKQISAPVIKPVSAPEPKVSPPAEKDSDFDGISDNRDKCPNTPLRVKVDENGCPIDSDQDGVPDYLDKCPYTPKEVRVDANGCAVDSDKDSIPDYIDRCPNTPRGISVDNNGCPIDSDEDGVPDYLDRCPNTPQGYKVDKNGCFISATLKINFEFNSTEIDPKYYPEIEKFAKFLKLNPNVKVEIQGHTDSVGSDKYNLILSQKRAEAVRNLLIKKYGINPNRLTAKGYGESKPVASNLTEEGRAKNRRVEAVIIK